ncbi:BMP family ABC transporter substrate-binding protein [Synergistales bacterium]|nr:BMP family ABC transporter substrate-binding protein [Synergistales bacterium]
MKKLLLSLCAILLMLCLCEVSEAQTGAVSVSAGPGKNLKVGVLLIDDEASAYSYNHMVGLNAAASALGIRSDNIIVKRGVKEDNVSCLAALRELAAGGMDIIFATSYGYEPSVLAVAKEYPNIQFCHASGNMAAGSGLPNMHNYFTKIFEARYLTGIAAGLKAKEVGVPKLGYVGAFEVAEVISGFTAFYLGAKSVYPDVTMDVIFTQSWADPETEKQTTEELIKRGCAVISQHSNTNMPAVVCEDGGVFHVGYNWDMITDAPDASLVSARMDWSVYYRYALGRAMNGEAIDTDWCGGYADGAVYLSPLNKTICAPGTDAAIKEIQEKLTDGLHVFSGPLFGTGTGPAGETAALTLKEGEFYDESGTQSAPSFHYIVSGVNIVK